MAKFVLLFRYTPQAWAALIENPSDREAAARGLVEAVGGSLESLYWMGGDRDGLVIVDVPSAEAAAALSISLLGSGAFGHVETRPLFDAGQLRAALGTAREARGSYAPPGQ